MSCDPVFLYWICICFLGEWIQSGNCRCKIHLQVEAQLRSMRGQGYKTIAFNFNFILICTGGPARVKTSESKNHFTVSALCKSSFLCPKGKGGLFPWKLKSEIWSLIKVIWRRVLYTELCSSTCWAIKLVNFNTRGCSFSTGYNTLHVTSHWITNWGNFSLQ